MTRTMIAVVGRVVLLGTVALAGSHTVYYLYHWEWVRAQIAATAFVAALVVAATWLVTDRIARLEHHLDTRLDALQTTLIPSLAPRLPEAGEPTAAGQPSDIRTDFPWLATEFTPSRYQVLLPGAVAAALLAQPLLEPAAAEPRMGVFIPVLLSAGLLVSMVAGLVERAAAAKGGHDARHADTTPPRPPARSRWRGRAAQAAAAVVVMAVATQGLWWWAHYRPENLGHGVTEITVHVATQTTPLPAVETVDMMGRYCARTAIQGVRVERVDPRSVDTAILVVSPLLDEQAQRRYGGCLEDLNLDRHRLRIVDAVLVPTSADGRTPGEES